MRDPVIARGAQSADEEVEVEVGGGLSVWCFDGEGV